MNEHPLYPEITPFDSGQIAVDSRHTIYYEQCGNPEGKPAVFLHGGPGAGAGPSSRRFFDPDRYRIVLFDQRGCGRSTPHADLIDNTTAHLVDDIEQLRRHLGIERWLVFGGSWGSTLALAYAERHPERATELVLRGIFTLRRAEIQWFYQHGAHALFPDAYQPFRDYIPVAEQQDMVAAYHRRLTGEDRSVQREAAARWSRWEASASHLHSNPEHIRATEAGPFALAFARIEAHYFVHGGFFEHDNQLLRHIDRIRDIPAVIVHGRYDVVCPLANAWALTDRWPEAELQIVPAAGHSAFEPGNRSALVAATDRFAER